MSLLTAPMDAAALRSMGILNLAHVGDGVYELLVRSHLAALGDARVGDQHRRTIAYVSAPAQAAAMELILPCLTEEEHSVYRRGRNARVHGTPAGCTPAQYHAATALEALFGWLWLAGREERLRELFELILEDHDGP